MGDFAFLAPIAGYYIGGAFGPVGSAVGWMVGSWVMNATMDDRNDVMDSGAEEMPRFNQALRGTTIPIFFGTNRVPSNIVWAGNYRAVREEQGSDGKAGGSGGGKAPAQSGQASYAYFWDLVYHMGMSDDQMGIFSIWLGPDRIDDEITAGISVNSPVSSLLGFIAQAQSEGPTLRFDEAYYYGGGQIADSWPHLDTEIGSVIRFPWTMWLGFKQLALGAFPRVPQLTFEVGPVEGGLTEDQTNAEWWVDTSTLGRFKRTGPNGESTRLDKFGQSYSSRAQISAPSDIVQIISPAGSVVSSETVDVYNDEVSAFLADDWDTTSLGHGRITTLLGGEYVALVLNASSPAHSGQSWEALCIYEPVEGGKPTLICAYRILVGFSTAHGGETAIFLSHQQTINDSIVTYSNKQTKFRVYPSIFDYINLTYKLGGPGVGSPRTYEVPHRFLEGSTTRLKTTLLVESASDSDIDNITCGFWVRPKGAATAIQFYLSKAIMTWHNSNPTHANRWQYCTEVLEPANPNGAMIEIDLGLLEYGTYVGGNYDESDVTVVNSRYIDQAGSTIAPFSDDGDNRDGSAGTNEYKNNAIFKWLDANRTFGLLILHKLFSNSASQISSPQSSTNPGIYIKIRAFIYDIITDKYKQFVETEPILLWDTTGAVAVGMTGTPGTKQWKNQYDSNLNLDADFNLTYQGEQSQDLTAVSPDDYLRAGLGVINPGSPSDLTPAEIIRRLLQNDIYGRNLSNTVVDQTSFAIAHQYCLDNGFLVSTQYRREQPNLSIIHDLLAVYDGFLSIIDGQIKFGVRELTLAPVKVLDNDHFIVDEQGTPPIQITKGAAQDTYNKIRVNFISRSLDYQQDQIEIGDEVDQDFNGTRIREFPSQFVMSPKTAMVMGSRALWSNLYARDRYQFKLGIKDQELTPGDVVTLVDSLTGLNTNARIVSWRETKPFQFTIGAAQEHNYINASSMDNLSVSSPSSALINQRIGVPLDTTVYELPCEFSLAGGARVYASYRQNGAPMGATLYISADGTTYAPSQAQQPYPLAGTFVNGLPDAMPGTFTPDVKIIMSPSSGFETSINPITVERNETLADISDATRAVGGAILIVGSEVMAYEGVTLLGQNYYNFDKLYRGWGGTHIHSHAAGDSWFKHGSGVFFQDYNENQIGTNIWLKIVPFDSLGNAIEINSIVGTQYTIQGTHHRPQVPPPPRLIVGSVDYRGQKGVFVNSTIDIDVDWRDTSRKNGYGTSGYGAGAYGRFLTDTLSHSWRVEVVGSDDVIVRSTVVGTAHFTYTSSENFEDNGAWRGNVALKVTPFSVYGDAPRSEITSLNLWV